MERLTAITTSVLSKSTQSSQKLQCRFSEVDSYTLQFSISRPASVNITPVAIVTWSLGGVPYTRKISVFDGASITGVAEHVVCQIIDETDQGDPSTAANYEVTISVGRGVRGSVAIPPTYQQYYTNGNGTNLGLVKLDPSSSFSLDIPRGAGVSSVMITAAYLGVAGTPGDPENIIGQVTGFGGAPLKYYNPNLHGFVPISPQTVQLVLYNNDTAEDLYYNVTFGVDG